MRAADRAIFDQLHRRVGIAHPIAALGSLADELRPVAIRRRQLGERRCGVGGALAGLAALAAAAEEKREGERSGTDQSLHFFLSPGLPAPIRPTIGIAR